MTMAEVHEHPGRPPRISPTEQSTLTVTQPAADVEDIPPEQRLYTAAEVLEVALGAYERGLTEGRVQAGRDRWREPALIERFRAARIRTEVEAMKRHARAHYEAYGYSTGYDYRGGPVDYETAMPPGSGCAWLRRARRHRQVA